ncbi:hypothetical protein IWX50DRAFT_691183 [Phyllosticta citricarpa]
MCSLAWGKSQTAGMPGWMFEVTTHLHATTSADHCPELDKTQALAVLWNNQLTMNCSDAAVAAGVQHTPSYDCRCCCARCCSYQRTLPQQVMPKYNGEKLEDSHNFKSWQHSLKQFLEFERLWEHVQDGTPAPEPATGSVDEFDHEAHRRYANWKVKVKDYKAKSIVRKSLAHEWMAIKAGLETETAHTMFNNLVRDYHEKAEVNKYSVYQSWHELQWDGTYFDDFSIKWRRAVTTCRNMGIAISNEVEVLTFVSMVANCRNSHFEDWARQKIIHGRGQETPDIFNVMGDLRFRWKDLLDVRRRREEVKKNCGVCGMIGHTPSCCWHLEPDLRPKKFRQNKKLARAYKERMEMSLEDEEKKER